MFAQGRTIGPEWVAAGADAQRTYWQKTDPNISVENLSKPGFELIWTSKIPNAPRQSNMLSEGVTINGIGLFWPVSLVTGSSNNLFEIDNDTGNVQWSRNFGPLPSSSSPACPGGIAGAAARVLPAAEAASAAAAPRGGGAGGGRGAGYRGAVGQPGEGVPAELSQRAGGGGRNAAPPGAPGAAGAPAPAGAPPVGAARAGAPPAAAEAGRGVVAPGAPGAAGTPPGRPGGGGGLGRIAGPGYAISADGALHVIGWLNGKDIQKPAPFLPPNARFSDPIAVSNVLYVATAGNCSGASDGVWAIDLASEAKPVTSFKMAGRPIGSVALTTDERVIASIGRASAAGAAPGTSNAIVALEPRTLQLKDWFSDPAIELASQPVIFKSGDKEIVAGATTNGRIVLLDAASLGGADHATPLAVSQPFAATGPEALATWQEMSAQGAAAGTRWLLMATSSGVAALKVVDEAGKPVVQAGWTSREIPAASIPLVVNGVVFAASTGKPPRATPSVLYALDAATGKEIWNSGKAVTSFVAGRSLWSANSQVHVATHDGTIHAFGFALERK